MILEKTLPILATFFIGLLLKRVGILRKEHGRLISQLILYVALPATLLNSLSSLSLSPGLLLLPAAGLAVVTLLLALAFLLAPLLGLQGKMRGTFLMAFPTLEIGSVGYVFMLAVYGGHGLALIALFDMGNALFFFTVVAFLAATFGQRSEHFRLFDALRAFARNPMLWAYALGIALHLLPLPGGLLAPLFANLAQPLVLLIMLLIACEFEFAGTAIPFSVLVLYVKMAVGVTVGLLVSLLFHLTGVAQIAVVLGSAMPASLMTVMYARENELDGKFLASMLSFALPTSICFSYILIALVH